MTEDDMSDAQQEGSGRNGPGGDEDRSSGADRDGPIPFLEELFRGDGDPPEAVRRQS